MARAMTFNAHLRATLTLGLPLIGSQLAQFLIQLTDTVMVGWYGVTELAALVVAVSLISVLIIFGSGFAFAVMPLVAAAAERGDAVEVRRVTRMGLWASMGFCAVTLPPLMATPDIFLRLNQPADVAGAAWAYLAIAGWGVIPALIMVLMRSYLSGLERARIVLWVTLGGVAANAGLNWLLIFGNLGLPELGIEGAAIASLGSHAVMAAGLILYAVRVLPEHALFVRLWRADREALRSVFRLGWPIGLTNLAEVGLFAASSILMGWVGTQALAAHGIALQLATATFMVHLGLCQAATVRAGQAMGRGDVTGLRRAALAAIALSGGVAALAVVAFLAAPETLIAPFLDPADPDRAAIIGVGVGLLAAAALFQLVDAAQVMALGLLRGVQDTRVPMLYAAVSYWGVGAPVAYLLGLHTPLGGVGVWLGLALGLTCAAGFMMHRFWRRAVPRIAADAAPTRGIVHGA